MFSTEISPVENIVSSLLNCVVVVSFLQFYSTIRLPAIVASLLAQALLLAKEKAQNFYRLCFYRPVFVCYR